MSPLKPSFVTCVYETQHGRDFHGRQWHVQRSMELKIDEAKLTDLSKLRVIELQDGYQALISKAMTFSLTHGRHMCWSNLNICEQGRCFCNAQLCAHAD